MSKEKTGIKEYTVYIPIIQSEVYYAKANSAAEALTMVEDGEVQCNGEVATGKEYDGVRVVEGWKK